MVYIKYNNIFEESSTEELNDDKTIILESDKQILFLEPKDSDKYVILPNEESCNGLKYTIINTSSSYSLIIKNDNEDIISTIKSGLSQIFACNGILWTTCSSSNENESGYSGYSGISGYSGEIGISGYSGYSGISGYSGYSGKKLIWKSLWEESINYYVDDIISHNNNLYICIVDYLSNIGSEPGIGGSYYDYWDLFLENISGYSGYSGISGYFGYSGKSGYSGAGIQYFNRIPASGVTYLNNISDTLIIGTSGYKYGGGDPSIFISQNDPTKYASIQIYQHGTESGIGNSGYVGMFPVFILGKTFGNNQSMLPVTSGTDLGTVTYRGSYSSGKLIDAADIKCTAEQDWYGTSRENVNCPTTLKFLLSCGSGYSGYTGDIEIDKRTVAYITGEGYFGIGEDRYPEYTCDVFGTTRTEKIIITNGANSGYVLSCGVSGEAFWETQSSFIGYSGISGYSGKSGYLGTSGYSGKSGYSGISGYSGYSGLGFNWRYDWDVGEYYYINDIVYNYKNGNIYICINSHDASFYGYESEPGVGEDWGLFWGLFTSPYINGYIQPEIGYKDVSGNIGISQYLYLEDFYGTAHQLYFSNGLLTNYECCFLAGTKILMENNECKNIEDIIIGDKVIGGTVKSLESPIRDHYYYIVFENDLVLKVTDEHPIMTNNGWASINPQNYRNEKLEIKKLELGNHVKTVDGYLQIIGWIKVLGDVQTYNLSKVSPSETFYANGFLVHNKCLDGNTLIKFPGNLIKIKDLKVGDSVFGIKDGKEILTEVINIYCKETLYPLSGRMYNDFICTDNHKFLNNYLKYDKIDIECKTYDLKTKCGNYVLSNGLISINDENEIFGNF